MKPRKLSPFLRDIGLFWKSSGKSALRSSKVSRSGTNCIDISHRVVRMQLLEALVLKRQFGKKRARLVHALETYLISFCAKNGRGACKHLERGLTINMIRGRIMRFHTQYIINLTNSMQGLTPAMSFPACSQAIPWRQQATYAGQHQQLLLGASSLLIGS